MQRIPLLKPSQIQGPRQTLRPGGRPSKRSGCSSCFRAWTCQAQSIEVPGVPFSVKFTLWMIIPSSPWQATGGTFWFVFHPLRWTSSHEPLIHAPSVDQPCKWHIIWPDSSKLLWLPFRRKHWRRSSGTGEAERIHLQISITIPRAVMFSLQTKYSVLKGKFRTCSVEFWASTRPSASSTAHNADLGSYNLRIRRLNMDPFQLSGQVPDRILSACNTAPVSLLRSACFGHASSLSWWLGGHTATNFNWTLDSFNLVKIVTYTSNDTIFLVDCHRVLEGCKRQNLLLWWTIISWVGSLTSSYQWFLVIIIQDNQLSWYASKHSDASCRGLREEL